MDRKVLGALWEQIQFNRVDTIDHRTFVPPSSLQSILTPAAVSAAVSELTCSDEDRLGLAGTICEHGIITFAILIWIKNADAIVDFRRHMCLDERLPLDSDTASAVASNFAPTFLRTQVEFLPHQFSVGEDVEIPESRILPFVSEVAPCRVGGFGAVRQLEVHSSVQTFFPPTVKRPPTCNVV